MVKTHARYPKGIVEINRLIFLHKLGIRVIFNTEVRRFLYVEEPKYALTVNSCLMVQRLGDICRVTHMPCFTRGKLKERVGRVRTHGQHDMTTVTTEVAQAEFQARPPYAISSW